MIVNGIDLTGLEQLPQKFSFPEPVNGRVAQIDADFLAYQASFERKDDPKTLEEMQHNARVMVENIRLLAGAETVHLHLTPGTSDKGDRFNIAVLKPYQANREDKAKPRYLHVMRNWFAKTYPGTLHQTCEADDGMAAAQYACIRAGRRNESIIVSKDKDLGMVHGLHMDWDTGEIEDVEFGYIWLDDSGSSTKLRGKGEKFFWAQMLMGDGADNISGLPFLHPHLVARYAPPTSLVKAGSYENYGKALAKIKPKKVGPVLAYAILEDATSAKECFARVKECYQTLDDFVHWQTGEKVTWQTAFKTEAQLLWMRVVTDDATCVFNYFRRIG